MQSVKNGFAPPFSLCFSKSRAARQSPFCKAVARPFQSRRKALPKSTKTGRKSVGFLILTQAPKCTRSHCFPPQKHPKNGFMMRFAGKNSFFQLRARDFSFYMNAYTRLLRAIRSEKAGLPFYSMMSCGMHGAGAFSGSDVLRAMSALVGMPISVNICSCSVRMFHDGSSACRSLVCQVTSNPASAI